MMIMILLLIIIIIIRGARRGCHPARRRRAVGGGLGRGNDTVGNPHRAQISQFGLFEFILLLNSGTNYLSSNSSRQDLDQQYPPPPS